jgi:hypothetical protein
MDDDLIFATQEMGVEEEHVRLLNELKYITRINVHDFQGMHV